MGEQILSLRCGPHRPVAFSECPADSHRCAVFIAENVTGDSVDCFHIYFPDPWPKKRHHKRRFFCAENLEQLIRCMKPAGQLRIATDHAEYFEQIKTVL